MKKFKEIDGITDIKVKTDYCELKGAIYRINGIIRSYLHSYAFPSLVEQLKKELIDEGIKVNEMKMSEKYTSQRKAVLDKLKDVISVLKNYSKNFSYDETCTSAITASTKFQIQRFLKARETQSISVEQCMELLKRNLLIYQCVKDVETKLNTSLQLSKFVTLQNDVKTELNKLLEVYDFT